MVSAISTDSDQFSGNLVLTPEQRPDLFYCQGSKRPPSTPSEWFVAKFPQQAKVYGTPFVEQHTSTSTGKRIIPIALNTDFFAAALGGSRRIQHRVIYFQPDLMFYYYEPAQQLFKPTSEEKLQNQLRAYLMRCAQEMPESVDKLNLCIEFRSDKQVKAIVHRAKSILAADPSFFSPESKFERYDGPEIPERLAKLFIEQCLEQQENQILTVGQAYDSFTRFSQNKGVEPVKRPMFKALVAPGIREVFNLGLRNDLIGARKVQECGWKNLRALDVTAARKKN